MNVPWGNGEWRRVLVYGLGLSGLAAARLLRARGVEVVAVDRRTRTELELGELESDAAVTLHLGSEPEALPAGLDGVVVSPGVPRERPLLAAARAAALPVVAEVELAFPFLAGGVIAVTGANGKSTTTALTGHLLAACGLPVEVCGNIGLPLSACVDGPPGRIFVVELSSFQLEATETFRPRAAALLNVSPDHLDRHGSLAAYLAAKQRIFAAQSAEDVAVLNADDPAVAATPTRARRRFFSLRGPVTDGCYLAGERVLAVEPGGVPRELFRLPELALPGVHNLENAMAAMLLAQAAGTSAGTGASGSSVIRGALATFRGLPHRMERVAEHGGVVWYDDSKGTNVAATARSLEGFADGTVHLILGGRNKGADPAYLRAAVGQKAKRIYLIGEAGEEFRRALADLVPAASCDTLARAVAAAAAAAQPGEVVLLSPACASFDQFRDYVDRGERFHGLVHSLLQGGLVGQEAGL